MKKIIHKIWPILYYGGFFICCFWMVFFSFVTSTPEYQWMVIGIDTDLPPIEQWPKEMNAVKFTNYMIFLFYFIFTAFVFLRQKNVLFIVSILLVFCYANYIFWLDSP